MSTKEIDYQYYPFDTQEVIEALGKEKLLFAFKEMVRIRNFEIRAESAYQQGKIGGFFHAYIGQEAIQTAALVAMGPKHWWITTYRCHALALLLGVSENEIMSELFGKANGNALGRGGSMHLYAERLLGGFGIVGGQVPVAAGAAFSIKYRDITDEIAVCFLGDGAVPQGAVHEALNLMSLWDLPCLVVVENNQWGMGTHFKRANAVDKLAEQIAPSYGMEGYTLDGMDFFACYQGFKALSEKVKESGRPIMVEVITERFRGHSISDPGLYRTKEALKSSMAQDPILKMKEVLQASHMLTEEEYEALQKEMRQKMQGALKHAEESPWPSLDTLEEGVFA